MDNQDNNEIVSVLKQCRIFENAQDKSLQTLSKGAVFRDFMKGESIFNEGEESESLYVLASGRVAFNMHDGSGKHFSLGLIDDFSILGELEIFSVGARISQAMAHQDSRLVMISKTSFEQVYMSDPDILVKIVKHYAFMLRRLMRYSLFHDVDKQLAYVLFDMSKRFGKVVDEGIEIDVYLPQEFLASMIGVPRQRINNLLKTWEEHEWISLKYSNITLLDSAALKKYSEL